MTTILDGYKSWIAGIGLMALGVYMITQGDMQGGIAKIGEGLAVIGLAAKLEKGNAIAIASSGVTPIAIARAQETPPRAG